MMKEMNDVAKFPKTHKLSLALGHNALDDLEGQVGRNWTNAAGPLHQCKFKLSKAKLQLPLAPDWTFESGVIKIQSDNWDDLTLEEEEACKCLLKPAECQ